MSDLDIAARIERLERRVSSQRNLIVLLIGIVALAGTLATTEAQQKSITFADANGVTRVTLDADGLVFTDANGKKRESVGTYSDGDGYLQVFDADGTRRIYLGYTDKENPELALFGTNKQPLIEVLASDKPATFYYDSSGTERAIFGMTNQNDGFLRFFGSNGKDLLSLEAPAQPFMRIYDGNETERMWIGMTSQSDTGMEMYSAAHAERAYLGIYSDNKVGLSFFDASGGAGWSSP